MGLDSLGWVKLGLGGLGWHSDAKWFEILINSKSVAKFIKMTVYYLGNIALLVIIGKN